jgi:translation initiation factor 3 subunit B
MENGYRIWTFSGNLLSDTPIEAFKQFLWRPRPPTLLSKEEQRNIRRTLREYSREFEEADKEMEEGANAAVIELRRRLYSEWYAWVQNEREDVQEERVEFGIVDPVAEAELERVKSEGGDEEQVVEEVAEEVVEETEEFA